MYVIEVVSVSGFYTRVGTTTREILKHIEKSYDESDEHTIVAVTYIEDIDRATELVDFVEE